MVDFSRRQALAATAGAAALAAAASSTRAAARPAAAPPVPALPAVDLAPRERLSLDFDWRFKLGHAQDPARDFGFGANQGTYAKAGRTAAPAELDFDAGAWAPVTLPHDWAVELPFVDNPAYVPSGKPDDGDPRAAHGYKPLGREFPETSIGWYRKTFALPAADAGKRLSIEFDGAFRDALVIVNGYILEREDSGYSPFRVDITDIANVGGDNSLVVRVDASLGEGWFYEGAGLYRHVWLVKTAPVHVPQWGVFVRARVDGTLSIDTDLVNEGDARAEFELLHTVLDAAGRPVLTPAAAPGRLPAWERQSLSLTVTLPSPVPWTLENPHLYSLVTEVKVGGAVVDRYVTRFGVRSVVFDADKGFLLNGASVKLKGTCNHQDHAGVGAAIPDALQVWRLEQLKSMGCNAYRASHNPPTPELLDACDRLGIVVIDETRRMSSDPTSMDELERLVRRDRNHPSVILWSIGNEEPQQATARGAKVAATMKRLVNRLDPSRLVIAAMDQGFGEGISAVIDVQGFNYRHEKMDDFHARFPHVPVIGTESASTVSTRGEYARDDAKAYVPAYDTEHPWWATTAEKWWSHAADRPWMAGGFIWTGFDYRGEPTPFNRWPSVSSHFGALDTCGFPKDNYYYYRAWWRPEPLLHLLPHWNWEGREGQPIAVWAHSNCDKVELFLNGKSQGVRDVVPNHHVEWSVPYAPGVIEAHGYKAGKVILRERRETAGPAAALRLTADRSRVAADGQDVAILKVEVLDAKGRSVPRADDLISFTLSGPGQVIGVGNGDPTSHESDLASQRKAFNGLAQAIVRTRRGQAGELRVTASAPGLKASTVSVAVGD
ncbi:beta-galactosidase [Caulobacter sp. Root487D2Y]|uniref:beta-galactosidase GalA n=1 Tax=Caulobacter sp. Root487D2Y TaxID=1736547 RepID=UPI0006FAEBFB|nr:beta-galactosidase GalA [Caulobacter sp. Root487D2Y]KQY35936.1 beta-galactosidase [Caulobacter sp. Root487D2Y]